jgi:hypothetical protein
MGSRSISILAQILVHRRARLYPWCVIPKKGTVERRNIFLFMLVVRSQMTRAFEDLSRGLQEFFTKLLTPLRPTLFSRSD